MIAKLERAQNNAQQNMETEPHNGSLHQQQNRRLKTYQIYAIESVVVKT